MTIYAVGDIQGCLDALQCLLEQVSFDPKADQLWCAGDLVNRGPKSLETLRFIKSLGTKAKVVLGNHDLHLLATAYTGKDLKAKDSMHDILAADDKQELLSWLKAQPLMIREQGYTMVHAGICPTWTIKQAEQLATEVKQCLDIGDYTKYFNNMYGNTPNNWSDELTDIDRLRVITNYFTRIRYCKPSGELELQEKKAPTAYPNSFEFSPWYECLQPEWDTEKIIFGHWASLQGNCPKSNIFALDTGCVWGGNLTMMRLGDDKLFHCECN